MSEVSCLSSNIFMLNKNVKRHPDACFEEKEMFTEKAEFSTYKFRLNYDEDIFHWRNGMLNFLKL